MVQAQTGDVILWNRLGSDVEVTNSEMGPNGTIIPGPLPLTYDALQFGNGVRTHGSVSVGFHSRVRFFFDPANKLADKGTMAFWVRPDYGSDYGGIARWIDIPEDKGTPARVDEAAPYIYWRGWERAIAYGICQGNRICQQINVSGPEISFRAGDTLHVAIAWDLNGINGTGDKIRAYFNGKQVAASTSFDWPHGVPLSGPEMGGSDYNQYAAVDNLVIYDFAKTDFSDRFNENPIPSCEGVLPKLSALISSKTGTQDARTWTVTLSNKSYCPALKAQIDGLKLTQTYGVACTPVITSPASFPLELGDIAANGKASGPVTINFSACPNTARFSAKITYSANDGAVKGSKTLNNQYR